MALARPWRPCSSSHSHSTRRPSRVSQRPERKARPTYPRRPEADRNRWGRRRRPGFGPEAGGGPAVEGDHVTGVDGGATGHGRPSSGERSYRGWARLDRPGSGVVFFRHHAHPGAGTQAQAVGTPGLRVPLDGPDRLCHRLSARVLLLSVVPELRPLGRPRVRVRRREELHRGALQGPALHGLGLEHRAADRPVLAPRAPAGPRDRAPAEPRAARPAHHHGAPGHSVDGLAGDGRDGVADDVRRQVRGDQQPRTAARDHRRLLRLVLVAARIDHRGRAGGGLAQHAVHDAGAAGRAAVDPDRALRGRQGRRRQRLAALLVDHLAAAQVHDGRRRHDPADRPDQAVRAHLRADLRRARRRHRDGRGHDVPDGLPGLPHEPRRGALPRDRRRRAAPDPGLPVDAAGPGNPGGGLMAIAIERSAVMARRAKRHRVWLRVGHALTYLGLFAALVFFLGPFFWIVTTSLKGNEDFFAFPPVWIPTEPSLEHYVALFTRSSGARYFTHSLVLSTLSMISALVVKIGR